VAVSVSFWSKFGSGTEHMGVEANCPYSCLESSRSRRGHPKQRKDLIVRLLHGEPRKGRSLVTLRQSLPRTICGIALSSTGQLKTAPASRVTLVF
jgi:hypothetical protein